MILQNGTAEKIPFDLAEGMCYTERNTGKFCGSLHKRTQEESAMSIHLKIASDFVCPYCYVLEAMIEQLQPELDVEIEYLPFELTEPPQPQVGKSHFQRLD